MFAGVSLGLSEVHVDIGNLIAIIACMHFIRIMVNIFVVSASLLFMCVCVGGVYNGCIRILGMYHVRQVCFCERNMSTLYVLRYTCMSE